MAVVAWAPGLDITLEFRRASGTWVDITSWLRSGSTAIARSRTLGAFPPGSASFRLDNRDGRFAPGHSGSPYNGDLYPGRLIRLRGSWTDGGGTVTATLWTGIVDDWGGEFAAINDATANVVARQTSAALADWRAGSSGVVGAGETAAARVSRVLTAAGWAHGSVIDTSPTAVAGVDLGQTAGWSAIQQATDAEGGACWCDQTGQIVWRNRHDLISRATSTTSQGTFGPANVPYYAPPPTSSGADLVVNQATVTGTSGVPQTRSNTSSMTTLGAVYGDVRSTIAIDDAAATSVAEQLVTIYGAPVQHPTRIRIRPGVLAAAWRQIFGRNIRDRITVIVPTPWGTPLTLPCWIVGMSHSFGGALWETAFDLEPVPPAVDAAPWFTVGVSAVGGTHRIAW